ncbi:hypothetical protein OAG24_00345 [bacterium]|nr:hypothetical protein [bacterium]
MTALSVNTDLAKRQISAINRVKDLLKDYPTFEGRDFDHKNETVVFTLKCNTCQNSEKNVKYKSFRRRKNKCSFCERENKGGRKPTITLEDFENLLNHEGWEFSDKPENFKNATVLVEVTTPLGEISRTSYTKFKSGMRSRSERIQESRTNFNLIREEFKNKGFILKAGVNDYENNRTKLYCACAKCGAFYLVSYKTIKSFSKKCKNCGTNKRTKKWDEICDMFLQYNFEVISDVSDYQNSQSNLKVKCTKCDEETERTWNKFYRNIGAKKCHSCNS